MAKIGQIDLFTKRVRQAPAPRERSIHILVADRLRWDCRPDWEWTHFPAGELRAEDTGALLKRMGLKPGWPDFLLVSPEGGRLHGLELKRRGRKPTDEQEKILARIEALGGRSAWCTTYTKAVEILDEWGCLLHRVRDQ